MKHSVKAREDQLLRAIPDITGYKTALYVGANMKRMEMVDVLHGAGCRIDVIEIWPRNFEGLRLWNKTEKKFNSVVCGDIRDWTRTDSHDIVMWWHGPEHIPREQLPDTLGRLERAARVMVVLACPAGRVVQGEAYGNPWETHTNYLYPHDFRDFGYRINILGKTDREGSNLIAWKRRRI